MPNKAQPGKTAHHCSVLLRKTRRKTTPPAAKNSAITRLPMPWNRPKLANKNNTPAKTSANPNATVAVSLFTVSSSAPEKLIRFFCSYSQYVELVTELQRAWPPCQVARFGRHPFLITTHLTRLPAKLPRLITIHHRRFWRTLLLVRSHVDRW